MDKDGNRSLKLNASFGTGSKLKKLLNVGKKITNNVTKTLKQAQQALSKVIDKTISRVSKVSTGNIKGTTLVKVKNKSTSMNKALAPIKRTIVALKCPKKEKKAWYEEAWDGVKSFGKDVWNGLTGAASWIWSKVCDAGSFLIQGAQQILSMIDDVLDVVAFGAAVAVFAAGVIALGTSIASTIPALATTVVLGHEIGAIGGYSTGFALFTGKIAVGASGYGLDFKKISKGEAKSRVANGIRNLSITYVGLESVMISDLIKGEFRDGGGQGSNNHEESSGTKEIGNWEKTNEAMSDASRNYQKYITGTEDGVVYKVNGVKFDGYKDGELIEVKGNYSNFVDKSTGEFQEWFTGQDSIVYQANRQLTAANGVKIQWYFNDEISMNAVKKLFLREEIEGIQFILKPMK